MTQVNEDLEPLSELYQFKSDFELTLGAGQRGGCTAFCGTQ